MSKKIIIYLLIFLVILSLIVGYFYYKSQKVAIQMPVATDTPIAEIKPEVFKSEDLGFQMTLSDGLKAIVKTDGKVVIVGDKILIYELDEDPEKCKGVCSVLIKKEDVIMNNIKMRYLEGYWEELGSENAQSFVSYIVPRNNKFLVFMMQELPIVSSFEKGRKASPIVESQFNTFSKIIESVVLLY